MGCYGVRFQQRRFLCLAELVLIKGTHNGAGDSESARLELGGEGVDDIEAVADGNSILFWFFVGLFRCGLFAAGEFWHRISPSELRSHDPSSFNLAKFWTALFVLMRRLA